ncbi:hypothetical protein FEM48_Zijuj09G0027500 [Ziziphus jujuba var. spinosa]|uniref:CW-type domain-containing protein n=1 Tax=Ziziphus jujuba var. spinosa TaxID=714518 RepID=A0A978UQF9_ZIZJJ|nr:hypothetical protein FEM48_Zijuj09G0027500 [Ziziphus jujuba var. spinosa]
MISVGCRDARKEKVLGFGGGGREMEDTELEEGEACSYPNNGDYDASIDPDIALSYLDEKLQDVLGHFQKDFEGGVSAENLGAKFGGYGSFLPTYQRSPVCSHPRTPPKVQKHSTPRSPNNLQVEGCRSNSLVSSSVAQSGGHWPASTSSTSLPALKAPAGNDSGKQEMSMAATCVAESTPRFDSINKRSANVPDQKTLKVRIKVGSDNLSTRKNAAIYSGLGLDDSPTSSLDDSPSESEGISHEPQNVPFESPTSILQQIMTSFPVHGGLLLSPLPDDLIHLIEKEKLSKEGRYVPLARGGPDSFGPLLNGSDTMKGGGKIMGKKNMKPAERNDNSAESKNANNGDARNGIGGVTKREQDLDALICEELVSKTLKLPILSNSYSTSGDMILSRGKNNKGIVRDKLSSDQVEEEPMESTFTQEHGWVEKPKASSAGKGLEDRKRSSIDEIPVLPNKEGQQKGEKNYDSVKDGYVAKGRKVLSTEIMDSSKQKANQKAILHEQQTTLHLGKDQPFPGKKKKSKGSHGTLAMEVAKESLKVGSSVAPKTKKSIHMDNSASNSDSEIKLRKDLGRTSIHRDFFGDLEEEENQTDLLEVPSENKLKDAHMVTKSLSAIENAPEGSGANKFDKQSPSASYPVVASNVAPHSGNGPISDSAPATVAPVVIEESWVCCDKCQKWRLLPLGTNPDHLPEKWLCSMLNWLPGLNRCSVSEEETTKALIALYQLPAPESQNNLHNNPGGYFSGATLANFRHPDQNPQNFGWHTALGNGKKKHLTNKEGPTQLSNSVKKIMQASVKSRSLNDVNNSPLMAEPDLQQVSKSSDLSVEKQKYKHKEKLRAVEPPTDGGDTKNLKMRSKKDSDQDSSRASKKIKTENKNITDEDWASDHSGATGKVRPSSSSGLPASSSGKDRIKYSDRSSSKDSKDSKFDAKDRFQVSVMKPKVKGEVSVDDGSIDMGNTETRDNPKKRRIKEFQNGPLSGTGNLQDSTAFVKEEFSENDYRKEKKARTRTEGKESSGSKGNGRTDKKSSRMKNQQLGQDLGSSLSQRSLEGMDCLKRDLGSIQAPLAATSSSSKVSGSHKTKSSFHEVKGSPVESVSSSPMRISNPNKLMSVTRDLTVKDDLLNAGHFANGSPKLSYDGEDFGGSDQTRAGRKDKAAIVAHHGSLESTVHDFQDRDFNHIGSKARKQASSPSIIKIQQSMNGAVDNSDQDTQHPNKPLDPDQFGGGEKENDCHYRANGYHSRKSGKGSSSRLKDKNRSSKSDLDMDKVKNSDVHDEPHSYSPSCEVKPRDGKSKLQVKSGDKSDEIENKFLNRKACSGNFFSESSKRENQLNLGDQDGLDLKVDAISRKEAFSPKQILLQECKEKSSQKLVSGKTNQMETASGRGRSPPMPPSGGSQIDSLAHCPRPVTGLLKGNGADTLQVNAAEGNDVLKFQKQIRKGDEQNGYRPISSRHPTKNGHRVRDLDTPSPVRRDPSGHAANVALKEAKDLKRMADRFKNSGLNTERTGLYLQAALKFLHGASLLESSNCDSVKHNDMTQSVHIYSSTAKLCEFCAHEYEKSKDMAAAALAYKCVEVAYMRVIYSTHASVSKDRHELLTALQMIPPGESPSSSASDVDNLNNPTTVDKVAIPKGVTSPQVAANHVIAGRHRTHFSRLLTFTQDICFAMEASRKSRIAFAAVNANMGEAKYGEGISSIKKALDFNFQDIDGLLRLLRLAMEAISR